MGIEAKSETIVTAAAIGDELRAYSRQRWPLANDKHRKSRIADLLNVSARRIKSFWEGEATAVPRPDEIRRVEALTGKTFSTAAADGENRDDFMAMRRSLTRRWLRIAKRYMADAETMSPAQLNTNQTERE